jgi:hypothetical protein
MHDTSPTACEGPLTAAAVDRHFAAFEFLSHFSKRIIRLRLSGHGTRRKQNVYNIFVVETAEM